MEDKSRAFDGAVITLNFFFFAASAQKQKRGHFGRSTPPREKQEGPEWLVDVGWTLVGGAFMSAPELRGGICPVLVGASLAIILCPY